MQQERAHHSQQSDIKRSSSNNSDLHDTMTVPERAGGRRPAAHSLCPFKQNWGSQVLAKHQK